MKQKMAPLNSPFKQNEGKLEHLITGKALKRLAISRTITISTIILELKVKL